MKHIFKIASLLAAVVMLFSCEKQKGQEGGTDENAVLTIVSDRDVIQSNGKDVATLKVLFGEKDVTADAIFHDETDAVVSLDGGKFTATADGEYKFWAEYGTSSTYKKNLDDKGLFTIKAISVAVPPVAEDAQKGNTSFVHRAFLTQYTGTGCGYCPYMIKIVKELMAEKIIPEKAVHAAVHSYSSVDPAYIAAPKVNGYPYLTVDLVQGFSHSQPASALKTLVDDDVKSEAMAGISVNPVYYSEEGTLVVSVSVKAAVDGLFNVGAWLLEDEIFGQQEDYDRVGDSSYNTHENCVRIADSRYLGSWFGHPLGTLKAGDAATKTFVMKVKKSWKLENLHLAVFASYGEQSDDKLVYTVCNAVDAPIDVPTPFQYK